MKKQMIFALAALAFVGSTAMAEEISDISLMITNGKIAAIEQDDVNNVKATLVKMDQLANEIGMATNSLNDEGEMRIAGGLLQGLGQIQDNAQQRLKAMQDKNNFDQISQMRVELQAQYDSILKQAKISGLAE